jgi:hypothetical protein
MLDTTIRPDDLPVIKVIKDVLQQLDVLQLRRQTYGHIYVPTSVLPADADMKTKVLPLLTSQCSVCIKAACVLSMARVLDCPLTVGNEDIIEGYYRRIRLVDYIDRPKRYDAAFDRKTWHMMEAAFEMAPGVPRMYELSIQERGDLVPYLRAAAHFGRNWMNDHERVYGVMEHLLQHNGKFELEPISKAQWNALYTGQSWYGRDVNEDNNSVVANSMRPADHAYAPGSAVCLGVIPSVITPRNDWEDEDAAFFPIDKYPAEEPTKESTEVHCKDCGAVGCDGSCPDDADDDDDDDNVCAECGDIDCDGSCEDVCPCCGDPECCGACEDDEDDEDEEACCTCGDVDCDGSCDDEDDDDDEEDLSDLCRVCGDLYCDGACEDDEDDEDDVADDEDC